MKQETIDRIRKFSDDRDWEQFHSPANLAKSISIEAAELLERYAVRPGACEGGTGGCDRILPEYAGQVGAGRGRDRQCQDGSERGEVPGGEGPGQCRQV